METIRTLMEQTAVQRILALFIGLVIIYLLVRFTKKSMGRYVKADSWYKTKKAIHIFGYLLLVVLVAVVYSDRLGGLNIALGVAGAGVAFALQEVIASVAGWVAILVGGFYKTGDRVLVGGIRGDVIDLGALRTTVMELGEWVDGDLYNGRIVRIANSFVFKAPVYNYSADFPFLWDEIKIPIEYGSDYELARDILRETGEELLGAYAKQARKHWEEMVRKFMIEDASTDIMITMEATDNWVAFTLRYVVDYRRRRSVRDALFRQILTRVADTQGAVRFASATIDITDMPAMRVKVDHTEGPRP